MPSREHVALSSRAMFLGASAGDALGWPQEQNSGSLVKVRSTVEPQFQAWVRRGGSTYNRYRDPVHAGGYSDDTQLLLAGARAVTNEDWFGTLTRSELPLFLLYQRGAGGATLRSCRTWAKGKDPWTFKSDKEMAETKRYFQAGGNGVAMRIAPHVVSSINDESSSMIGRVVLDGTATHGHPRALVGAAAYATSLRILMEQQSSLDFGSLARLVLSEKAWQSPDVALNDLSPRWLAAAREFLGDPAVSWMQTVQEMVGLLTTVSKVSDSGTLTSDLDNLARLGTFDRQINGAGTVTTAGAIYLASRNAPRPMSGMLRAAFLPDADTDTLASMTGALLGALQGAEWLEAVSHGLQDMDYILRSADSCVDVAFADRRLAQETPSAVRDSSLRAFREHLREGGAPPSLPNGRPCHLIHEHELEMAGNSKHARRWVLDAEGQTLIVDQTHAGRPENSAAPKPSLEPVITGMEKPRLNGMSLRVRDISAVERFYRSGIGVEVRRLGAKELLIDGFLRCIEDKNITVVPQMLLSFRVNRLETVAERFDISLGPNNSKIRLKDPEGNDVDILAGP